MPIKFLGLLSCLVGCVVAAVAMFLGFGPKFEAHSSKFTSKIHKIQASSVETVGTDNAQVIVLNERCRGICLPSSGFGAAFGPEDLRLKAEKEYRQHSYRAAAKSFEQILKTVPSDIRAQLGLGKTYIALGKFEDSVKYLSQVRNECHRVRCRRPYEDPGEEMYCPTPFMYSDIDSLPEHAGDALDQEARLGLETAVLEIISPEIPESAKSYKTDRHFKVLNASLNLAKKYHVKLKGDELAAMFQLALENTRTLPAALVTDCCISSKGTDQRWHELARLALNAAVDEEREWYLKRMVVEADKLPNSDIRKAATNHALFRYDLDPHFTVVFQNAKEIRDAASGKTPKQALLYAHTAYDYGLRAYEQNYDFSAAREYFLFAHEIYSKCGTIQDLADTNYNLGMISFELDDKVAAKNYFKQAANISAGKTRFEQNELAAACNYGVLAVDSPASEADEKYLQEFFDDTHHPEAAVLLGLHYMQKNEFEKAYAPLKTALMAITPATYNSEFNDPVERDISRHIDLPYSDDQVFEALFVRQKLSENSVCSRFASNYITPDYWRPRKNFFEIEGTPKVTTDRFQTFDDTVRTLFPIVLKKTNRENELQEHIKAKRLGAPYQLNSASRLPATSQYYTMLTQALASNWYAPSHSGVEQVVVRAKITDAGTLAVSQIESSNELSPSINASVLESVEWTALPAPPPAFSRELILVYNLSAAEMPKSLGGLCVPMESNIGEW